MPKNIAFFIVIAFMGLSALIFSLKSGQNLYNFWRLDKKAPLEALSFSPHQLSEDKYTLWVHYRYLSYEKNEELASPVYKNPYAAEEGAKKLFKGIKSVWIDSSSPAVSSLTKEIAYKELAYTLILWGLTLYFFFLNRMVVK